MVAAMIGSDRCGEHQANGDWTSCSSCYAGVGREHRHQSHWRGCYACGRPGDFEIALHRQAQILLRRGPWRRLIAGYLSQAAAKSARRC